MPSRSSRPAARPRARSRPPRRPRRRWPWLIVVLLLGAALYYTFWRPQPTLKVGILAGHWQYDSGATCPDGLREVDITVPVARRVVELLQAQGYPAEMLPEYSDRLTGYRAAAFVSLHADSCLPELSGFKVVGSSQGLAPGESARLAAALKSTYGMATGLGFHANTITPAMTDYYAFHRLDPRTPAAIIEMGFMGGDGKLLTQKQDLLAQSIAEGVLSFLRAGDQTPTPVP